MLVLFETSERHGYSGTHGGGIWLHTSWHKAHKSSTCNVPTERPHYWQTQAPARTCMYRTLTVSLTFCKNGSFDVDCGTEEGNHYRS